MASALGCDHYVRKCKFVTPCCQKLYTCRFCHDDKENHPLNRNTVKQLICAVCNKIQAVRKKCQGCGTQFGQYCCLECNLFDDDYKGQFHCSDCGLCRVGGWENFFHCGKCNLCLNVMLLDNHKCIENVSRASCPVCLEDMHTSRIPCKLPKCGHLLHSTCYDELLKSGHDLCPVCQKSLKDVVL